jgi:copper(I)-binding protein
MKGTSVRFRRAATALAVGATMLAATAAHAVEVSVTYAWMRPASATTSAKVYVEIASDTVLELTGATSPFARKIDIVFVEHPDGTDEGRVVKSLPVAAAAPTRLAYLGSHLRFVDLAEDVSNATKVPLTLEFTDGKGASYKASTTVQVRGILRPQSIAPPSPSAAPAGSAPEATGAGNPAPAGRM